MTTTVLDQVLAAEKEAEAAITAAKESAQKSLAAARAEQSQAIEQEKKRLKDAHAEALTAEEHRLQSVTVQIESAAAKDISTLHGEFASKRATIAAELVKEI